MKKTTLIILLLFAILLAAPINAASLKELAIDISINNDNTADWTVTQIYNESVLKSDYFVLASVTNLEVLTDNTSLRQRNCRFLVEIGTSIICENINAKK